MIDKVGEMVQVVLVGEQNIKKMQVQQLIDKTKDRLIQLNEYETFRNETGYWRGLWEGKIAENKRFLKLIEEVFK